MPLDQALGTRGHCDLITPYTKLMNASRKHHHWVGVMKLKREFLL